MTHILATADPIGAVDQEKLRAASQLLAENKGEFVVVKIDELNVDHRYQRELSRDLATRISDNYDILVAGPILVNKREDGTLWIVNGQHRVYAAGLRGETEMLAVQVEGLGPAEEAALRLQSNVGRPDTSLERFKARFVAGDPTAIAITNILLTFDTKVNAVPNNEQGINAVAALEEVYRADNSATMVETLKLIREAWERYDGTTASASMLKGISWFLLAHRGEFERQRLLDRLVQHGPQGLGRMARNHRAAIGGPLWLNTYRALVEAYNHGLTERNRLEFRTKGSVNSGAAGTGFLRGTERRTPGFSRGT